MKMYLWFGPIEKALSTEDHQNLSADGAPPGVYTSNMTEEWKETWKGKIKGTQSGIYQVEIRKVINNVNFCATVTSAKAKIGNTERYRLLPGSVQMSMNGTLIMSASDWIEFNHVVCEAQKVIEILDGNFEAGDSEATRKFCADARENGFPLRNTFPYNIHGNPNMAPWE